MYNKYLLTCTTTCEILVSIYIRVTFSPVPSSNETLYVVVKVTSGFVMRNRSVSIVFGSLVLWAVATYFLFLDQQSVGKDLNKVERKKLLNIHIKSV
jgi:hypothetical protein